jgi:endonuclease VIII
MPEGHTLYRIATELTEALGGQRIAATSPQGRFAEGAALLDGAVMEEAEAAGKHLLISFDTGNVLHVHLGLIGSFVVHPAPPVAPVGAVRLRLEGGDSYADLRGPMSCEILTEDQRNALLGRLGPDPLRPDADPDQAWQRIRRSNAPIGVLVMDQSVLSGVGNVYRAEILFRARLDPHRPGRRVRRSKWLEMWADLVALMHEGVRTGRIDTVREAHTPEAMGRGSRVDDHGGEVYVYRRAGQPCHVCRTRIRTQVIAGRNLFWCPRCQRSSPGSSRLPSRL